MQLSSFNTLNTNEVEQLLYSCCGSHRWVSGMMTHFPFASEKTLVQQAEKYWYHDCGQEDWLAAFTQHPKIGDVESLTKKFAATQHLAGREQAGVELASREVIESLAAANQAYENRFGFIFIVFATGKTAPEMLRLLQDRLENSREEELHIAMGEQHKITILRLKKLLPDADWGWLPVSQITTHVLDTTSGSPARDLSIRLERQNRSHVWETFCQGVTNADGRIADLLPPNLVLSPGTYQIVFETGAYFAAHRTKGFYPAVQIQFEVPDAQHYHVPLLLNPFGYSTYRGS